MRLEGQRALQDLKAEFDALTCDMSLQPPAQPLLEPTVSNASSVSRSECEASLVLMLIACYRTACGWFRRPPTFTALSASAHWLPSSAQLQHLHRKEKRAVHSSCFATFAAGFGNRQTMRTASVSVQHNRLAGVLEK